MRTILVTAALLIFSIWGGAWADELPPAKGEVLLTITGPAVKGNSDQGAQFDISMLESLEQHTIDAEAPFLDGMTHFEGPYLRDVIELAGVGEATIARVSALDQYEAEIPLAELAELLPILAIRRNGQYMPAEDKGPLFIIYDYNALPEAEREDYHSHSVWSVVRIELE